MQTIRRRFFSKVEVFGDCWLWTGAKTDGYGVFNVGGNRIRRAHRVLYEWRYGPIPDGLVCDHICRNRACVKPSHIRITTHRENILSGTGASARNARKTHCVHGHRLTPENIYEYANGRRVCRVCRIEDWASRPRTEEQMQDARDRAKAWYRANKKGSPSTRA